MTALTTSSFNEADLTSSSVIESDTAFEVTALICRSSNVSKSSVEKSVSLVIRDKQSAIFSRPGLCTTLKS